MNFKKQYEININISRNLDILYKRESEQKAAYNFKKLLNTLDEEKNFLFILNSMDEIDITSWISIALKHRQNVYCLVRKSINDYYFLKIDEPLIDLEIFKNTLQPKCSSKIVKDESLIIDYIVVPVAIFNKEKYFVDNVFNMNFLLLSSHNKSLKIGYAYSFQSWDIELKNNANSIKIDYLVTEDYFF